MPGVHVHFVGIDEEEEKRRSERGSRHRKARSDRRRKVKEFKKSKKMEREQLKRFRSFLWCKGVGLLTRGEVNVFYVDDEDYQQNVDRLTRDLVSDDFFLNDDQVELALWFLMNRCKRDHRFGPANDYLQMLFAIQDLETILDDNRGLFEGHLEGILERGDYDTNKGVFLQRNLCVDENSGKAGMVLELKRLASLRGLFEAVPEGDDNSEGTATSGSSGADDN